MGAIHDEVIRPGMLWPVGAKKDAGVVIEPQTSPFGLFYRNLEPLPTVTVSVLLGGQVDNCPSQGTFLVSLYQQPALCRT
jgi:hypothetical protein